MPQNWDLAENLGGGAVLPPGPTPASLSPVNGSSQSFISAEAGGQNLEWVMSQSVAWSQVLCQESPSILPFRIHIALSAAKPPTSEMTWVFLCKGAGPFQAMAPQWRLVKMLDPRWCVWFPGYLISSEQCKERTAPWVLSCFFPDPLISSTAAKPLAPSTKHSANTADPNMLSPLMLYLNPPRVTPFVWQE